MVIEAMYGSAVQVSNAEDGFVHLARRATTEFAEFASAATLLVDSLPLLNYVPAWFPGGNFQRQAANVHKSIRTMMDVPYAMVKDAITAGTASPSLTTNLVEEALNNGTLADEEEDINGAAGVLFEAGTETSVATITLFFLAMTLHPEIYKKAQNEVDRVIGKERLPTFDDRASLPYLECILKELYRWNVPTPLGVFHELSQADEYRGYAIPPATEYPKYLDKSIYPDPEQFRPERFEEMDAQTADAKDPRHFAFGIGRRICPGRKFGDEAIWIAIANIMATLEVNIVRGANSREVTPAIRFLGIFSRWCHSNPCFSSRQCRFGLRTAAPRLLSAASNRDLKQPWI